MPTKTEPELAPGQMLPAVKQQTYEVDWWNPKSFHEASEMAEIMAKSDLVPKDFKGKPGNIIVAWSFGAPLGLQVLSSLQHISVINGRPAIWGDGALAVCMTHPAWVDIDEQFAGEEGTDDFRAICVVNRKGQPECRRVFSVPDAKRAGLWGKNVWGPYPKRMLQMRARSWALRDTFPDALCGMPIAEEVRDITDQVTVTESEPEGKDSTDRLKNKLRPKVEVDEEPDREVIAGTPEAADQEEPKPKTTRRRKAKAKAKAKAEPKAEEMEQKPEDYGTVGDGMGGEQPEEPDGNDGEPPLKTVEQFIAEAETSEDLTRLNEEIRHRYEGDEITKQRQMELMQLVHERSQVIAKGK